MAHKGGLKHRTDGFFRLNQVRGARLNLTFELFPKAPFAFAHFGFRAHAFDMRPGAFGHFRDHREFVRRPYMRRLVVDCHERGQPALLDQRHSDGRADANALEGRSLFGRDFVEVIGND